MSSENKGKGFGTVKRIAALIAVVLILSCYIVALIAVIGKWENSQAILMTAIYLTIAVPVIIYIMQAFYKLGKKKGGEGQDKENEDPRDKK